MVFWNSMGIKKTFLFFKLSLTQNSFFSVSTEKIPKKNLIENTFLHKKNAYQLAFLQKIEGNNSFKGTVFAPTPLNLSSEGGSPRKSETKVEASSRSGSESVKREEENQRNKDFVWSGRDWSNSKPNSNPPEEKLESVSFLYLNN